MRLPPHILSLCLAGTIGCEPAHAPEPELAPTPVERESSSLYDEFHTLPAVAPKYVPQPQQQQPSPQPQPQPRIKPRPPKRFVASGCGHAPENVTSDQKLKACGKG